MYRIYSSELPGHSLNFRFSRDGTYSKKALSFEVGTHYIYQQDIKILSTCLFNQTMRTVIITRIKCLMFKLVCKTPLFTKEKQHCKLNQLYCRAFYSCQSFLGQPRFAMFCSTTFRHANSKQTWLPNTLGMLVDDDAVLTGKKQSSFIVNAENRERRKKIKKIRDFPPKNQNLQEVFRKLKTGSLPRKSRALEWFATKITFTDSLYITK